ncbi:16S rRNA methyltransferase [Geoglobus ahangari]
MRFVFLEASLETIPPEISDHEVVRRDTKRRGKRPEEILLDDSKHHRAMEGLENREKRGRPDIVHQCLLALLDSSLEDFEVYVHTVAGKVIRVNRKTRLPRNYNRFVGLMEDLFRRGRISAGGDVLLEIVDVGIDELISRNAVVMHEGYGVGPLLEAAGSDDLVVCIGAFPHGDFDDELWRIFEEKGVMFAGFGDRPRTSLYVTYKTVCILEGFS